jgi:hypothetical protein
LGGGVEGVTWATDEGTGVFAEAGGEEGMGGGSGGTGRTDWESPWHWRRTMVMVVDVDGEFLVMSIKTKSSLSRDVTKYIDDYDAKSQDFGQWIISKGVMTRRVFN